MRINPAITLIASIVIGAVAIFAARGWLKPSEADATAVQTANEPVVPQTLPVVVAKRAIPRGASIDESRLEIQQWPVDDVPEDSFRDIAAIGSTDFAVRRALMPIEAGQAIHSTALTEVGQRPTLAARLENGFRAYSLRMSDVTGVGGFVLPGDRIDILFTWDRNPDSKSQDLVTEVLLQDIEVLGVDLNDDMADETPKVFKTATVSVQVEDALKLSLASQTGTLSFVLRGIEDRGVETFAVRRLSKNSAPVSATGTTKSKYRAPSQPANVRIEVMSGDEELSFSVPRSE